jgi:hypothetical protein
MARWIPISSNRLHDRRVIAWEQRIENATLLPFFDRDGMIQSFLLVDPAISELFLIREPARIVVPIWGPIRFKGRLEFLTEDNIEELSPHWHCDPWWLLQERPYEDNEWTEILKATNCVDELEPAVTSLLYSGNLARVRWVIIKTKEGYQSNGFSSALLPEYNQVPVWNSEVNEPGWRLAPFWEPTRKKVRDPD